LVVEVGREPKPSGGVVTHGGDHPVGGRGRRRSVLVSQHVCPPSRPWSKYLKPYSLPFSITVEP